MHTFFKAGILAICAINALHAAGTEVTTLKKELTDGTQQFVHLIGDLHFENTLKSINPAQAKLSEKIAVLAYKKICNEQRDQLFATVQQLGGPKNSLVIIEDASDFNTELPALLEGFKPEAIIREEGSFIGGLRSRCQEKDIPAANAECRHNNFGILHALVGIPLGVMNDDMQRKIDSLLLTYNDSPYLNNYYREVRNSIIENNAKIRNIIITITKKIKALLLEKASASLNLLLSDDENSLIEKLFTANTEEITAHCAAQLMQLKLILGSLIPEVTAACQVNWADIYKHVYSNFALASLVDAQILHHIYTNPQVKHIFICAGAAHTCAVTAVLTTPEMGYQEVCATKLDIPQSPTISYREKIEQMEATKKLEEKVKKALDEMHGSHIAASFVGNILDYRFSTNPDEIVTIFVQLTSTPLIKNHFEKFTQLHPKEAHPQARL